MTIIIRQQSHGTSAAINTGNGVQSVMCAGVPFVQYSFRVRPLQQWLTTLEEVIVKEENANNRLDLENIYFSIKAIYNHHLKQHEEIITAAPTADDLQAYLAAYAAEVGAQSL